MTGKIGQFKGPFTENQTITLDSEYNIQLGIAIGEKDCMKNNWKLRVLIDNEEIWIKHRCIYNPDVTIFHHTITFPDGAPESTIVDYIILEGKGADE